MKKDVHVMEYISLLHVDSISHRQSCIAGIRTMGTRCSQMTRGEEQGVAYAATFDSGFPIQHHWDKSQE